MTGQALGKEQCHANYLPMLSKFLTPLSTGVLDGGALFAR